LRGIVRLPGTLSGSGQIPSICGRFGGVWALERLLCPFACSRSAQSPAAYSRLDVKFAGAVLAGGRSDSSVHRVNLLRGAEGLRRQPLKSPPVSFRKMGRSAHGQRSAAHRNCPARKCWVGGSLASEGRQGIGSESLRLCTRTPAPTLSANCCRSRTAPDPALAGGTGNGQAMALAVRPCSRRTPSPKGKRPRSARSSRRTYPSDCPSCPTDTRRLRCPGSCSHR
jgi:hypothetical protein